MLSPANSSAKRFLAPSDRPQRRENQLGGKHAHLRGIGPRRGNQRAFLRQMAGQRQLGSHVRIQICAISRNQVKPRHQGAEQENGRRAQAAQPLLLHHRFPCLSFRFFYYSIVKKSCQTVGAARPFRKSPFKINGQTCAACQPDRFALILSKVPNSSAGFHFLRSESGA